MKQLSFTIAFLLMIISSENAWAQTKNETTFQNASAGNVPVKPLPEKKLESSITNVRSKLARDVVRSYENIVETKAINVNTNAVRDFIRSNKDIPDPKWFKSATGYIASFTSNGIDSKIFYDRQGRRFYNLLTYTEHKLPFAVRDIVKREYYDDAIHLVYQFELEDEPVYIIIMHDKQSNLRTIKVWGNEMEDITNL